MLVAVHGLPGAGKSAFCRLMRAELAKDGIPSLVVRLSAPLYEAQAVIHAMAGRPVVSAEQQDSALVRDLAAHFRRINPDVLADTFAARVAQARQQFPEAWLICDDMEAPDAESVVKLGFRTVEITAPQPLRRLRRTRLRGVLNGDGDEVRVERDPDFVFRNTGTLEELQEKATWLVQGGLK